MDKEPKLPTPQIEPEKVADAILKAATKHERDVKVGATAVLNTMTAKLAPSLGDKMTAKQADRQQFEQPPVNPEGALYKAGGTGHVHGPGGDKDQPDPVLMEESKGPAGARTTR